MKKWFKNTILHTTSKKTLNILHKSVFFGLGLMFVLTVSMSDVLRIAEKNIGQLLSAVLPSVVVDLTNDERADKDLQRLRRNPLLDQAAKLKAEHMKNNDYFAHFSPEGVSPWHWFDSVGYDYIHAGENLAVFFDDSDDVVQAWMDSPLHRDNILKEEYTEIGVATVETKYQDYSTVFVVQLFGTPLTNAPAPETVAVPPQNVERETIVTPTQKPVAVPQEVQGIEETTTETVLEEVLPLEITTLLSEPELLEVVEAPSETVISVPIEGNTVYISEHISTSTHLAYTNPTEDMFQTSPRSTRGLKETLYLLTLLFVILTILASIVLARAQQNFVHAFYSIGLLVLTITAVTLHAQVVSATSLF